MKIAIIQFPGSNCERETAMAVRRAGMEPVSFLWNQPAEILSTCAGYILVGGFSYEDRSRAGVIAARDPLMQIIRAEGEKGKPILGICNGAQILVEAGLVPGLPHYQLAMALTENRREVKGDVIGTGFYNAWVHMRLSDHYQLNAFTSLLSPETILHLPVAHAEGRFVIPPALLQEMQTQGMHVFQYCDAAGEIHSSFPVNPNGSVANIAAVSNRAGNVLAMMPHPERTTAGDPIFQSMREYIAKGRVQRVGPMHYQPRFASIKKYEIPPAAQEVIVRSFVTDNQAISVQQTLQQAGIPATVTRYVHWEVIADSADIFHHICASGALWNDRKEGKIDRDFLKKENLHQEISSKKSLEKQDVETFFYLVQSHDDVQGKEKQQYLTHHVGLSSSITLRQSILWRLEMPAQCREQLLDSHILFNPYVSECYVY